LKKLFRKFERLNIAKKLRNTKLSKLRLLIKTH